MPQQQMSLFNLMLVILCLIGLGFYLLYQVYRIYESRKNTKNNDGTKDSVKRIKYMASIETEFKLRSNIQHCLISIIESESEEDRELQINNEMLRLHNRNRDIIEKQDTEQVEMLTVKDGMANGGISFRRSELVSIVSTVRNKWVDKE